MAPRAIWKGVLRIGRRDVPVKFYSALESRRPDFRLLHRTDLEPVRQRIVRKADGREVPPAERRKAVAVDDRRLVLLQPKDLERIEPPASRHIATCEFVAADALAPHWYDTPYHLGPDGEPDAYASLVRALGERTAVGIVRWTMREKRYLGALLVDRGALMVITLRRADQVLPLPDIAPSRLDPAELKLAKQLIDLAAGDFDPASWQDEYHDRLHALIEAKARGRATKLEAPKRRRSTGTLGAQLRLSLQKAKVRTDG